jgi:hypothetical protein
LQVIIIDVLRRAGADVTVASVEESLQVNEVSGSPNETLRSHTGAGFGNCDHHSKPVNWLQ